jgi:FkbM family methyltransferase
MDYKTFKSYSSYGEDALFNGILKRLSWIMKKDLFKQNTYIDIGAFHPIKESNTYFLYKKGWFGTLIEPNSYINVLTHESRPKDILLNYAVDVEEGEKIFYMFGNIDSSNTLSETFALKKQQSQNTDISWTAKVQTKTINQVITQHINYFGSTPMFMNIDIEGLDLDVIKTYTHDVRIPFIMIEDDSIDPFGNSETKEFMLTKEYYPIATTFLTTIYIDQRSQYFPHIRKIGHKI